MRKSLLILILTIVGLTYLQPITISALSSDPKHFITADNVFYSYVNAGENISVNFIRDTHTENITNRPLVDIEVTVEGPDEKKRECTLPARISKGEGCEFRAITAKKSGIWRVGFKLPSTAATFLEVPSDIHWGGGFFSWDITISDKDGVQEGRTWTERYAFRQPSGDQYTGDFTTYYISEDGYIYKATKYAYNGQISVLSADSVGVRKGDECVSAYQSTPVEHNELNPAFGMCGSRYKLFFEEPSGRLPEEAMRWDGASEWILPTIKTPTISELSFSKDNSDDQMSGTISFFLRNFVGQYEIKIDVDNDGSFDGQYDVLLRQQIRELSNSLQNIRFQGVDKTGNIIPPNEEIGIKVETTKVAEIHFVASDVEGRNGLQVTRLNGANAPTSRICWNDTELTTLTNLSLETQEKDGRSCPDSKGGLHGWQYNNLSWGNARYVDDWIYASAKLDGNNQITYSKDIEISKRSNGPSWIMPILIAISVIIVIGVVVAIVIRKRKRGQLNVPPPQPPFSPPNPPNIS